MRRSTRSRAAESRLIGDDGAGRHFEVAPPPPARPFDVLGPDDPPPGAAQAVPAPAPARARAPVPFPRAHGAFSLPSTARTAATAASIAVSTDASLPVKKNRPYRPTARTWTTSISAAFSASLAASAT